MSARRDPSAPGPRGEGGGRVDTDPPKLPDPADETSLVPRLSSSHKPWRGALSSPCADSGSVSGFESEDPLNLFFAHPFEFGDKKGFNLSSQVSYCRGLKDNAQGHLNSESVAQPGNELCPQERVSSKREKILFHVNVLQVQKTFQYAGDRLLHRRPGSGVRLVAQRVALI